MTFKTYEEYRAAQDRAGAKKLGISTAEFIQLRNKAIRRAGQPAKPATAPQKRSTAFDPKKMFIRYVQVAEPVPRARRPR